MSRRCCGASSGVRTFRDAVLGFAADPRFVAVDRFPAGLRDGDPERAPRALPA
jgi:hypothetical protein